MIAFKEKFVGENIVYDTIYFEKIADFQISPLFVHRDNVLKNGVLGVCFDKNDEDKNRDTENYYLDYQNNTLKFFQENQSEILKTLTDEVIDYYTKFHQYYEEVEDLKAIKTPNDVQKHIYIHHLFLHPAYFEAYAYYGLMAHCSWDDEGLGIVFYKNEVLNIGNYIEGMYSVLEIMKHNGMYDTLMKYKEQREDAENISHKAENHRKWWKFWK